MNFADRDPVLRPLLDHYLSRSDSARLDPVLTELGELAGGELDALAAIAEVNPPVLRSYAPSGERVDEVVFHPAYERMSELAFGRFGLAAMSHREGVFHWPTRAPHVVKYALSYVFVQAEFGLACPVSMTDSATRVLRLFDPERFASEIEALSSTDPHHRATGAMFMTEKQAGSDVGKTETCATDHGDYWTVRGHKWFCSNVTAEFILTLARVPGQGEGTRGLGMFLVPKFRPDESRNTYRIDRLKDKMGTHSMASGEVTLEDAYAIPVGDLERGFAQMAEMLNVSRLSNAMRSSALMRRAVHESIEHSRTRLVFGKPLFEQPLMRVTLLPLVLEAEAALGFVIEAAARLDEADAGDPAAARLIRVLTPLAKHTVCKRARQVAAEAMEVRGGNGYIEEWVNPRLLRDAHLGSIWEGSSNVIALDVLRCLRNEKAHHTVSDTYTTRLEALTDPATCHAAEDLRQHWSLLCRRGDELVTRPDWLAEAGIANYADELSDAIMGTLLLEQGESEIRAGRGYRKLLVAHTYLRRLFSAESVLAPAALSVLDQLADGGWVDEELALRGYEPLPSREAV